MSVIGELVVLFDSIDLLAYKMKINNNDKLGNMIEMSKCEERL